MDCIDLSRFGAKLVYPFPSNMFIFQYLLKNNEPIDVRSMAVEIRQENT